MNKDVKKFVQSLTIIDGVEARNSSGHIKIFKDDKLVVTLPSTPGDRRWRDNAIRDLRAVGITPSTKLDKQVRIAPDDAAAPPAPPSEQDRHLTIVDEPIPLLGPTDPLVPSVVVIEINVEVVNQMLERFGIQLVVRA